MELTAWLSLATICILGAMTPGPSLAMVLKHTVAGGRLNGVVTSITHGLAVSLYAVLTVLGMAVLINETPWLFNIIKYAGAGFLLWLAFKAFTAKSALAKINQIKSKVSLKQSAWEGFMIAFLNPKLAIFFLALFSQFIEANASWQQKVIMVFTVGGIDTLWYCLIAAILSHSLFLNKLRNNIHWVEKATGVALLGITARVLL
ncbi:MAG: lysine transporter LysE [Gammaproteobacteria bacterium]|nr:MAG: lysine transporter LysE [Gammaproteobacteria bacterium]